MARSRYAPIFWSKLTTDPNEQPAAPTPESVKAASTKRPRFSERMIASLVILGSMVGVSLISYFALIHNSLRLDESQSLWQSSHSLRGVFHTVALDVHVPLYHVILHFWIFFFGDGVVTIRLLSLLFFFLTIPVVYLLARQLLSFRWALFVTVLFSFSPFMNWYANEARMYTLLVLFASLSQYFFVKLLKTGKGWWVYGIVSVIGVYTHYFFLFTLAAEGLYFLANTHRFPKKSFRKFFIIYFLALAALSPWLYYFHSLGSASGTRPLLAKPSTVDFSNAYSQFLFGFQNNHINTIVLSSWPIIMLIALVAVRRSKKAGPEVSFIATMAILPVVLAYVLSLLVTPFFLSRYMISSVGPLLLLLVWLFSKYSRNLGRAVAVLLILATGLSSVQQAASASTPVKENYKGAVDYINQHAVPQDLVVISAPFTIYPVEYYYHADAQIRTLPAWNRTAAGAIPAFNAKTLPAQVAAQNKNHRYIYLLLSQNQGYENTIKQYYLRHFKEVSHHAYSDDLTLYVYQVGYYTVPPLAPASAAITTQ